MQITDAPYPLQMKGKTRPTTPSFPPASLTPVQLRAHEAIRRYRHISQIPTKKDLVPSYFAAVYAVLDTLTDDDKPGYSEAWAWLRGCLNKPKLKKGSLVWLKNSQKMMTDGAYALFSAVRWHRGNGSLWAMHPHLAARRGSLESKADTLAHVLFLISGTTSRATGAWKRALGR